VQLTSFKAFPFSSFTVIEIGWLVSPVIDAQPLSITKKIDKKYQLILMS